MKSYVDSQMTLAEFLEELHLQFLTRLEADRAGTKFAIWSLIVLGPGVQMMNSYTQPVITPLAQTAQQTGARARGGSVTARSSSW